jgi:hypothetical protein
MAKMLGFLVIILLLFGAVSWLIVFTIKQLKSANSSSRRAVSESVETVTGGSLGAATPSEGVATSSTGTDEADTEGSLAASEASANGDARTASSTSSSSAKQMEPRTTRSIADAAPEVAPVQWPYMKIGGVVGKGLKGAATINGKIVAVGESIDGVEVVAIGDYGVKLECQNETRFAKVGSLIQ